MIKSSDDANRYYSLIDSHIESYVNNYYSKYGVEARKIEEHLLKNKSLINDFLKKRGLSEVSGINRIVQDVLEDRIALHKDSVMTFESFSFSEKSNTSSSFKECLFLGISEPTIEHEKLLADLFDCSLSHIECVNSQKRIFRIDSSELESVIVYTDSELDVIYENMLDYLVDKFLKQELSVEGFSLGDLSDIVYPVVIRGRLETNFSLEDCRSKICELLGGTEVSTDTGLVIDL
jgi:hypothetical protein